MVQVDLTEREKVVLQEALEAYLNHLAYDITDGPDGGYRNMLLTRETVVRKVLEQFEMLEEIPPVTDFLE